MQWGTRDLSAMTFYPGASAHYATSRRPHQLAWHDLIALLIATWLHVTPLNALTDARPAHPATSPSQPSSHPTVVSTLASQPTHLILRMMLRHGDAC